MRRILVVVTVASLAMLGVAGCGTDGNPPGQTGGTAPVATGVPDDGDDDRTDNGGTFTAPHACDLLTPEVAAEFTGSAVDAGRPTDTTRGGSRFSTCGYFPVDTMWPNVNLALEAPIEESGVSWVESAWTGFIEADPDATPVAGYGDEALWSQSLGQLAVMANGWWLSFSVAWSMDITTYTLEDAKRLADLVLPTL